MKFIISILVSIIEVTLKFCEWVLASLAGLLSRLRLKLLKDYDYTEWLKRDLADCQTILELGCGSSSPILKIGYGKRTDAVDIWELYVKKHNENGDYHICYWADIRKLDTVKGYDAVVMLDTLEHLPFDIGFLSKVEGCARKKVILFTPNGFLKQDAVDGNPYQQHLSAWEPIDYLRRGYTVKGATGLRYLLTERSQTKYHPYFIFIVLVVLTQRLVFNHPNIAFHSYAVKEIK